MAPALARQRGYDALVHNITDINDKIYDAAPGASAELAVRATAWYLEDTAAFGLGMPDEQPKASEMIPQIVAAIEELVERGYAYEVDGDVYFRVAKFADYGKLSGQRPDQVEEQEPNARKEDPRDFALWKANKPGEDTWWDSPWGRGRPGWHIECSVMAEELLGPVFEIHGGGLDLVFPHHENELAQSRALGHPFAQIWTHNGMLRFGGEKMSKSSGNVATIREALDRWGDARPAGFLPDGALGEADRLLRRDADRCTVACGEPARGVPQLVGTCAGRRVGALRGGAGRRLQHARGLAIMHSWRDHDLLRRALDVFGLASLADETAAPPEVVELATRRQEARSAGDFAEADRLRGAIDELGWVVRDADNGFHLIPKR